MVYRLYLLTVSTMPSPTDEDRSRQNSHLGKIGLTDQDREAVTATLSDFKVQYITITDRYNQAASAALANGIQPDPTIVQQEAGLLAERRNGNAFYPWRSAVHGSTLAAVRAGT
jgi:hypothetical protein